MEYTRLGNTGLKVSRLALGCMSYGDPTTPSAHPWALIEDEAQPFFQQAVELGVTFWDTANVYQLGTSEEIVGRAITRYSRREDIVLATKVRGKMHDGPGGEGLSRKAILEQVDASLRRLGTDYIDLYQIHRFDPDTPVEETMEALHDIVKAGKVRYLGASSMYAWEFAKLQHAAALGGWTPFVSMQNQYNLLRRHDERELMAMCGDMGWVSCRTPRTGKAASPDLPASRASAPAPTRSSRPSTPRMTSPSSTPCRGSRNPAASAWPRSPWRGSCATRSCQRQSSAQPSPTTCRRQSLHSTSGSQKRRRENSRAPTNNTDHPGTSRVFGPLRVRVRMGAFMQRVVGALEGAEPTPAASLGSAGHS
jgi:diketogulonate reductase-like aldo/keto reductase